RFSSSRWIASVWAELDRDRAEGFASSLVLRIEPRLLGRLSNQLLQVHEKEQLVSSHHDAADPCGPDRRPGEGRKGADVLCGDALDPLHSVHGERALLAVDLDHQAAAGNSGTTEDRGGDPLRPGLPTAGDAPHRVRVHGMAPAVERKEEDLAFRHPGRLRARAVSIMRARSSTARGPSRVCATYLRNSAGPGPVAGGASSADGGTETRPSMASATKASLHSPLWTMAALEPLARGVLSSARSWAGSINARTSPRWLKTPRRKAGAAGSRVIGPVRMTSCTRFASTA